VAIALRAPRGRTGWTERALEGAVALSVVLQVLAVVATPLRDLLGTEPLTTSAWAVAVGLAIVPGVLVKVLDRLGVTPAAVTRQ
jgi:Ca2+-transporting ATPase